VTFRWGGVVRYGEAGLSALCGNAHDLSGRRERGREDEATRMERTRDEVIHDFFRDDLCLPLIGDVETQLLIKHYKN
jgi:hypothetical protein